jgi:hypothetical protein
MTWALYAFCGERRGGSEQITVCHIKIEVLVFFTRLHNVLPIVKTIYFWNFLSKN